MKVRDKDIVSFTETPKSYNVISKSQKLSKELNIHINGIGISDYLTRIENFESEEQFRLRKELTISQQYVFNSIIRIINKIFTA